MKKKNYNSKTKGEEEKIKNHPESSNNYLPVNLRSASGFACTELA